jgi:hypothetical protein
LGRLGFPRFVLSFLLIPPASIAGGHQPTPSTDA